MTQNWRKIEQETLSIEARFEKELESLQQEGIITQIDIQKVKNQVAVSRKALLDTIRRRDLQVEIQEELFASLIQDYVISIQRIIDDALFRLGADVFLRYKFGQVNAKAYKYANERNFSRKQIQSMECFVKGATAYALKTLPKKNRWSAKKHDYQQMINYYAEILQEYTDTLQIVDLSSIPSTLRKS